MFVYNNINDLALSFLDWFAFYRPWSILLFHLYLWTEILYTSYIDSVLRLCVLVSLTLFISNLPVTVSVICLFEMTSMLSFVDGIPSYFIHMFSVKRLWMGLQFVDRNKVKGLGHSNYNNYDSMKQQHRCSSIHSYYIHRFIVI